MSDDDRNDGRDAAGRFVGGNRIWEVGPPGGKPRAFETADDLAAACVEYFDYARDNPLQEEIVSGKDRITINKMRAMTVQELCVRLRISRMTWYRYAKDPRFKDVCEWATDIMFADKFTGAAAGLLNHTIIARELGLADKQEVSGPGGGPLKTITREMTAKEAAEAYGATLHGDTE